ncbi:MAG: ABC transporter ATP-binding protein [Planctomycetes bacterium]|nr:ABC transporter ATP-binding protein [Planctomycetota bacterium]MBL7106229.1 ABC transporter ATP-binding protein [Phycisphaerae bacterium]
MSIIKVQNLNFKYAKSSIIENMDFQIEQGSFTSIAGPNGVGKSTLLKLLSGLIKPGSGKIFIDSKPIQSYSAKKLANKIAVVHQDFVPAFGFTVFQTVMMSRTRFFNTSGFENQNDINAVNTALEKTDTIDLASRPIPNLSGGERQRVFIARALAQDSDILLLDEPTSFLDFKHQVQIYDLLKSIQIEQKKTIIAITHDLNLAAQYCDESILMKNSTSFFKGKTNQIFTSEKIEQTFETKGFHFQIGNESFFMPLGKFAKDSPN